MNRLLIPCIGLFLSASLGVAELPPRTNTPIGTNTWAAWRGDGTGVSPEKNLPLTWNTREHVRWSASVPGYGWSCPVVAGGKVFLTTAVSDNQPAPLSNGPGNGSPAPDAVYRWEVHCLDAATGRTLWKQLAAEHKPMVGNHLSNTYASETPVTDGQRVYAYFATAGLFAYGLDGKLAWSVPFPAYRTSSDWGSSNSPVLDGERIFVLCDNAERSFLAAFDTRTGKELWRTPRDERSTWATPVVWRNVKRTEIVVLGSGYIRSYDPATGKELWRLASERTLTRPAESAATSGESRRPSESTSQPERGGGPGGPGGGKMSSGGCKASPVANAEMILVGCAPRFPEYKLGPLWAVKAGASGDISLKPGETSNSAVAWYRYGAGPHFSSGLLFENRFYVFPSHAGEPLSCFDAKTGVAIYTESLPGHGGFKASPWVANGKIFCTDQRGASFVVEAGPQFKLLGKNLLDEMTWSSPAVANGAIFLRTVSKIFCITNNP